MTRLPRTQSGSCNDRGMDSRLRGNDKKGAGMTEREAGMTKKVRE